MLALGAAAATRRSVSRYPKRAPTRWLAGGSGSNPTSWSCRPASRRPSSRISHSARSTTRSMASGRLDRAPPGADRGRRSQGIGEDRARLPALRHLSLRPGRHRPERGPQDARGDRRARAAAPGPLAPPAGRGGPGPHGEPGTQASDPLLRARLPRADLPRRHGPGPRDELHPRALLHLLRRGARGDAGRPDPAPRPPEASARAATGTTPTFTRPLGR